MERCHKLATLSRRELEPLEPAPTANQHPGAPPPAHKINPECPLHPVAEPRLRTSPNFLLDLQQDDQDIPGGQVQEFIRQHGQAQSGRDGGGSQGPGQGWFTARGADYQAGRDQEIAGGDEEEAGRLISADFYYRILGVYRMY